jgi:hypothetical protein
MRDWSGGITLRIFGGVLLMAGLALGVFAYRSVADATDMGELLARVGEATDRPEKAEEWTTHWRATTVGMAMLAAGGIFSGLGFLARKRFAWGLLGATLAADAAWLTAVRMRLPRQYPWEPGSVEIVSIVLLASACAWAAWRSRRV